MNRILSTLNSLIVLQKDLFVCSQKSQQLEKFQGKQTVPFDLNAINFKQRAKGLNKKATLVSLLNHENFAAYHLVHCLFDLSCMLPALHIFVKAVTHHGRQTNCCDAKHRFLFDHNTISAIIISNLMSCRSLAGCLAKYANNRQALP